MKPVATRLSNDVPAVVVNEVTHVYGTRVALRNVSLEIPQRVLHGVIGPNGAGKTTLLKLLCTKLPCESGRLEVLGLDARTRAHDVRRAVGFLPDGPAFYSAMRVCEYLDFYAVAFGIPQTERRQRICEAIDRLHLAKYARHRIRELSRGWQQRTGLARMLVCRPKVLLLDEPAGGLDPRARLELMALLRSLVDDGRTVLIGSHILADIGLHCDSLTVLDRGLVRFSGPITELRRGERGGCCVRVELQTSDDKPVTLPAAVLQTMLGHELDRVAVDGPAAVPPGPEPPERGPAVANAAGSESREASDAPTLPSTRAGSSEAQLVKAELPNAGSPAVRRPCGVEVKAAVRPGEFEIEAPELDPADPTPLIHAVLRTGFQVASIIQDTVTLNDTFMNLTTRGVP